MRYKFLFATLLTAFATHVSAQGVCYSNLPMCYEPVEQAFWGNLSADFLWWKADVDSTEVALPSQKSGNIVIVKRVTPVGKWRPGLRIGLGCKPNPCDIFDVSLTWTYFDTRSCPLCHNHNGSALIKPLGVRHSAHSVKAGWNLKTNIIDLDLGREFLPVCTLSLRPHAGVRGAWFNFRFNQAFCEAAAHNSKFNYQGVGLKMGMDGDWHFTRCWSILAKLSGSLIYGKYGITQVRNEFNETTILKENDVYKVRSNIEAFLGVKWGMNLCCDRFRAALSVGYDISQWFHLNSLPNRFEIPANGNIGYQGLSARASFDF